MSFKTCFTKILEINPHPDTETTALEIATVYGFNIVIRKGSMSVGDTVFYIPVDSILNPEIEGLIFPPTSKVKLSDGRVRQIRLRKYPSQGLLVETSLVVDYLKSKGFKINPEAELEKDISKLVGIHKYEPPAPKFTTGLPVTSKRRLAEHPDMHGYNGLENLKWYPNLFTNQDDVVIQLKLHGTNARFGHLRTEARNPIQKILKFFKLLPKYHHRYGSNNVDITAKTGNKGGFYGEDIYGKAFKLCKAKDKVKPNELIFGEIIGEGIQKGYHYGHKEPHFVLFDVKIFNEDGTWYWLSPEEVEEYARRRGFQSVPVLYEGKYIKEVLDQLVTGADPYYPKHEVREGIVIKQSGIGYNNKLCSSSKKSLKYINPEYLDSRHNTDFH